MGQQIFFKFSVTKRKCYQYFLARMCTNRTPNFVYRECFKSSLVRSIPLNARDATILTRVVFGLQSRAFTILHTIHKFRGGELNLAICCCARLGGYRRYIFNN